MEKRTLSKAALFTLIFSTLVIGGWEIFLRTRGVNIAYDDGESLWADKRAKVYLPKDEATVFIGASRNKFDIDIDTWKSLTGEKAIQLAEVGSSCIPVLEDLADDPDFKGKLIIDITEGIFFNIADRELERQRGYVAYYKKRTPAERFSFQVNHVLESQFVFLDKDEYSLNALLDKADIPGRPGVFATCICPMEFKRVTFDRQNVMLPAFEQDTALQNKVKSIWRFYGSFPGPPPISGVVLDSVFQAIKVRTDKIKARGGKVIFVRTPSSGPPEMREEKGFPRALYWEGLLKATQCQGIHYRDYPVVDAMICPENSHLKRSDGIVYTTTLVNALQKDKGWMFPHKPANQ